MKKEILLSLVIVGACAPVHAMRTPPVRGKEYDRIIEVIRKARLVKPKKLMDARLDEKLRLKYDEVSKKADLLVKNLTDQKVKVDDSLLSQAPAQDINQLEKMTGKNLAEIKPMLVNNEKSKKADLIEEKLTDQRKVEADDSLLSQVRQPAQDINQLEKMAERNLPEIKSMPVNNEKSKKTDLIEEKLTDQRKVEVGGSLLSQAEELAQAIKELEKIAGKSVAEIKPMPDNNEKSMTSSSTTSGLTTFKKSLLTTIPANSEKSIETDDEFLSARDEFEN